MIYIDVDAAVEVQVNIMALLDDTDSVTIEEAIAYNESGMDLNWNFITPAGTVTQTNVVPTTGGDYDWAHVGNGIYKIEIPASGGASINNDTEGVGWFSGVCDGVLPWRSPLYCARSATSNDVLIEVATALTNFNTVFNTDFATAYDATNDVWNIDASGVTVTTKENVELPTGQVFPTKRYATDDTVDYITDAGDDTVNDRKANWALVQCISANDTRYAFDADPTQDAGGLGHDLTNGDSVVLRGRAAVSQFRYTSAANTSASAIQVTFGWNPAYV